MAKVKMDPLLLLLGLPPSTAGASSSNPLSMIHVPCLLTMQFLSLIAMGPPKPGPGPYHRGGPVGLCITHFLACIVTFSNSFVLYVISLLHALYM